MITVIEHTVEAYPRAKGLWLTCALPSDAWLCSCES